MIHKFCHFTGLVEVIDNMFYSSICLLGIVGVEFRK